MGKKTAQQVMDDIRANTARGHRGDKAWVPGSVWSDQLVLTMHLPQEWQRDADWLTAHPEYGFTYWPDGHKSLDVPNGGRVHLPRYP